VSYADAERGNQAYPRAFPCSGDIDFVGAVSDNTERKVAEQRLKQQEMELRQMLDFMPQLVVVFGPNHERLYANRAALDYRGIGLNEWREGLTVHLDDKDRVKEYADRASLTRHPYDLEVRLRDGGGRYRWFLTRYSPMLDDSNCGYRCSGRWTDQILVCCVNRYRRPQTSGGAPAARERVAALRNRPKVYV
jgi:PAS domain-containing protein